MSDTISDMAGVLKDVDAAAGATLQAGLAAVRTHEVGYVIEVGPGVARVSGLPGVQSEEVVRIGAGRMGMAFNLDVDEIGVILLDPGENIRAGDRVQRTGRVMDVPVGEGVLGRVIDPSGRPLDGKGPVESTERLAVERTAPAVLDRQSVSVPLQTGIKVVDGLIPIGRGQRELILGDRQTGKTAIALDAIVNQKNSGVLCIYCAIGQRSSGVAKAVEALRSRGAMEYTAVVVATGEDPAGLRWVAPYSATSMAEHFMAAGRDVLVIYDDLTRHARAYRELSLLLRRPPGREAFPGDIFYIHSRLLERATHLCDDLGGGSLTALPVIETEEQNLSAYIPTNLISITDGQIYLSPDLFQQGVLPAVEVGRSVSRVGGKAQLSALRTAASDLKLAYSQFQELERFSRYGARLEEAQRQRLEHGRRVREVLKQPQYAALTAAEQTAVLLAVSEGLLDDLPIERMTDAQQAIRKAIADSLEDTTRRIHEGEDLSDEDRDAILDAARTAVQSVTPSEETNASEAKEPQPDSGEDEKADDGNA